MGLGAPGVRAIYHPDDHGAYVLDPDGSNIEAVCHEPDQERRLRRGDSLRFAPLWLRRKRRRS
jgi:hypothetical protein